MKFAVFVAIVVIAVPASSLAADWFAMNDKYYIDRQSIRTMQNGYKRAWVKGIYNTPNKSGYTSSELYYEYDCNLGRYRTLSSIFYKYDTVTTTSSNMSDWNYASPESMAEILLNFTCRR